MFDDLVAPLIYATHLLGLITLAWATAALFGKAALLLGQPRVVGEMAAGIVLGPSVVGWLLPGPHAWFFSADIFPALGILSQVGLVLLMFQIGLEFDFSHLRSGKNQRAVMFIWPAGILFPFLLGFSLGWLLWPHFQATSARLLFSLFLGTALCVTAMPVLGRILVELDLTRTKLGALVITCAAFDDVVGWTLLALTTALSPQGLDGLPLWIRVLLFLFYLLVSALVLSPRLRQVVRERTRPGARLSTWSVLAVLLLLFLSALTTQSLGLHALFGGFWLGVLLHTEARFVELWREQIGRWVGWLLVPLFFTYTGLRTDLGGTGLAGYGWACLAIVVAAMVGKVLGCGLAARGAGMSARESWSVGFLMNTRGLLELVVAHIGLEMGLITRPVFSILVVMAFVTTVLTTPVLRWLLSPSSRGQPLIS